MAVWIPASPDVTGALWDYTTVVGGAPDVTGAVWDYATVVAMVGNKTGALWDYTAGTFGFAPDKTAFVWFVTHTVIPGAETQFEGWGLRMV